MASRSNGRWPRLPLERMSDIELLSVFEDAADEDGGATATAVAEHIDEGVRAARPIGLRFAWLKRWGYMDQEPDKRWFLTPEGEELRAGIYLNATEQRQIDKLARHALGVGDVLGSRLTHDDRRMLRRQLRYREVNG